MWKGFGRLPVQAVASFRMGGIETLHRCRTCSTFRRALKLTVTGMLDPARATAGEIAGEKLFFGKAQCSTCHQAPFYLDNQMHDLHVERFLKTKRDCPLRRSRCGVSRIAHLISTTAGVDTRKTRWSSSIWSWN